MEGSFRFLSTEPSYRIKKRANVVRKWSLAGRLLHMLGCILKNNVTVIIRLKYSHLGPDKWNLTEIKIIAEAIFALFALTKIKSWTRLATPRFAITKRRVIGPGIPSWSAALFCTSTSTTPGALAFSSDSSVAPEPATNC